jgi:DNA transformation protein
LSDLTNLPNIGQILAEKLQRIGVSNHKQLADIGSVEAIIRIGHANSSGCYNMLYALEGAIQGVRWHSLPDQVRQELKEQLNEARKRQ